MHDLKSYIREVPDFPKQGILFYDITTLLGNPLGLRMTVDRFTWMFSHLEVDKVVGIESRGFMFAPILAYNLNAGFVPIRKPGKLPAKTVERVYDLEYGTDRIQMHSDGVLPGEKVLIVDDLIATGGTARAAAALIEAQGAKVVGLGFVFVGEALGGRRRLDRYSVESLLRY